MPPSAIPGRPEGLSVVCLEEGSTVVGDDCDVVVCGQLETWALSYVDNRPSWDIVTFEPSGGIVRQNTYSGRYWWDSRIDSTAQTATFFSQGTGSTTIPWSDLRL